jgi:hypothetical protein
MIDKNKIKRHLEETIILERIVYNPKGEEYVYQYLLPKPLGSVDISCLDNKDTLGRLESHKEIISDEFTEELYRLFIDIQFGDNPILRGVEND